MIEWIAISVLVALPAIQLLGALLARHHYQALLRLADEILTDPEATSDDRKSVANSLLESTVRWPVWVLAATAPFWCIPFAVAAVVDIGRNWRLSEAEQLEASKREYQHLKVILSSVEKPTHSAAYERRYLALTDHILGASAKANPLLSVWIALWALPALLVFLVFGALDLARSRFRLILESMLSLAEAARARLA